MPRFQAGLQHQSHSRRVSSCTPVYSWLCAAALAFAGITALAQTAEGPVASVQRSLKEQQFYFGEVNGQLDEETRAALRRYQIHEGIAVSGEMDSVTLQALQSASGSGDSKVSATPGAERSVRGRARNLVQGDREFLDQLEGTDESTPTPAPQESVPPAPAPSPRVAQPREQAPPAPPVSQRDVSRSERSLPPEPDRTSAVNGLTPAEARRFVEDYLAAAEAPTPEEEVSFFADRVDYFDSGKVTRRFIEKDQRSYYRRWTSRNFDLIGEPEVIRSSANSATVRFRVRYTLRGSGDSSDGAVEEVIRLERAGDEWKIAGIRERKLPN